MWWEREGRSDLRRRRLLPALLIVPQIAATALVAACSEAEVIPPQIAPLSDEIARSALSNKAQKTEVTAVLLKPGEKPDIDLTANKVLVETNIGNDPAVARMIIPMTNELSFSQTDGLRVTVVSDRLKVFDNQEIYIGTAGKLLREGVVKKEKQGVPCIALKFRTEYPFIRAELAFSDGISIFFKQQGVHGVDEVRLNPTSSPAPRRLSRRRMLFAAA